jgi:beta-phosphoglucomutase family hydrolase
MLRSTGMTRPRTHATAPRTNLGLPPTILACLFDLDGVLTQTARLHAAAWKRMFDAYLRTWAERRSETFVPFDARDDYLRFVDGKQRADGVRSFLDSRGIELPEGVPSDEPDAETVHGLGNRKNDIVLALIATMGVEAHAGSIRFVRAARSAGLRCAVVSSSANCRDVLGVARIESLFEVVVDGIVAAEQHLRGKPAPDTFLAAARTLGVRPADAAVFEDAEAGVEAGRAGGFGFVVGVDRGGRPDALWRCGADLVVSDLAELLEGR